MATNNSLNNTFPNGISATTASEAININTTGSGTTTIGSNLMGNIIFTSGGSADGFFLNNANFSLNSNTGLVTINANGATGAISIGSSGTTLSLTSASTTGSVIHSSGSSSTDATFANTGTTAFTVGTGAAVNFESTGDIKFACNSTGSCTVNGVTINVGSSSITSAMTINAGSNITISPSAGTLTIGNSTGVTSVSLLCGTSGILFPAVNITTTAALSSHQGRYIAFTAGSAGTTVLTLPSTCAIGTRLRIIGKSVATRLFQIAQNAGQTIYNTTNTSTTGAGGSVTSDNALCAIELVCVTADTDFVIINSQGTFTFA